SFGLPLSCSTPDGVTEGITTLLVASPRCALGCSTPDGVTEGITLFAELRLRALAGAQRLTASLKESRRWRYAVGRWCLRAQRLTASLKESPSSVTCHRSLQSGCSTPDGVTEGITSNSVPPRQANTSCSTPDGVTEGITGATAGQHRQRGDVLNA